MNWRPLFCRAREHAADEILLFRRKQLAEFAAVQPRAPFGERHLPEILQLLPHGALAGRRESLERFKAAVQFLTLLRTELV